MENACEKTRRGGFVNCTEHIQILSYKFYNEVSLDLTVNILWGYVIAKK